MTRRFLGTTFVIILFRKQKKKPRGPRLTNATNLNVQHDVFDGPGAVQQVDRQLVRSDLVLDEPADVPLQHVPTERRLQALGERGQEVRHRERHM